MKFAGLCLAVAAGLAAAVAGYFALGGTPAAQPVWTEVKWPFPIDQWGTGRAFACKAADCGAEVTSIFAPNSAPATARLVLRRTPTSIA